MTGSQSIAIRPAHDETGREYFHHSSGQRISTDTVIVEALRKQYPELNVVVSPQGSCNLLAFADAGHASAIPIEDTADPVYAPIKWRQYIPPARRLDHGAGVLADFVLFGKYVYKYNGHEFLLYVANGRDGSSAYPQITNNYILTKEERPADELIIAATKYGQELHNEVWVFDGGYWQKSGELWQSVQHSKWEDVILEEGMKKAIIDDVENFFDSRETYKRLKVPWKRGIIYYGPPGNGKTISIKAMMHALYKRKEAVPTLYVRTLSSFAGPEYSLGQIFSKARREAPCYLVFEDLDSIVSDSVRSYFLNEVDGLRSNDGILMVGSTNHLDRLDPGISKRPSRFDRKYYFPDPSLEERIAYCHYWQGKLSDNDDLDFPDKLCTAIAKITDKFSFAYMQEAFVAALLAIAVSQGAPNIDMYAGPEAMSVVTSRMSSYTLVRDDPGLDDLVLWKEIKKQVKILREEMDQ
ncbi:P-loop containing nucleoside triphosphate hydrolase protein [Mytilinidion resinicola]|uniref:P-loop containing nucleoside triphosphate hydrolase protein n=1 Tax=Mytilinidion resinicola TaxID=574789 RepID=A0A6A6Z3E0_9PEZI|nr:P-loop containing nucleoside triphosphate hydrolase protein [Mytilinidion resinicola]KAF2814767.1 P-loop containing nucleoside triphosphate hydrolase protein [Mytilinidion resinicola]